jgi:hypothetical protein
MGEEVTLLGGDSRDAEHAEHDAELQVQHWRCQAGSPFRFTKSL